MINKCDIDKLLITLIGVVMNIAIASSQVNFRQISIDQGLPGTSVKEIFQDQYGVVWIGIEPIGLCKFDGKEYTIFESHPDDSSSISNNFVNVIVEGKEGIWIGTTDGLNKFDRQTSDFTRYLNNPGNPHSIPDNYIFDLIYDNDGFLWIGTRKGICKLNIKKNEYINLLAPADSRLTANIQSITRDHKGNIWIGTKSQGLKMITARSDSLNSAEWKEKSVDQLNNIPEVIDVNPKNLSSIDTGWFRNCRRLVYDTTGLLYVGSVTQVFKYNTLTGNAEKIPAIWASGLTESSIEFLLIDNNRQLWIGTSISGAIIYHLDNKGLTCLHKTDGSPKGLKSNETRAILEDRSGLIWLGTKHEGIHIYDPRQTLFNKLWKNKTDRGLNDNFIICLAEDSDNNILIGTLRGGINIYNPKTQSVKTLTHDPDDASSIKQAGIGVIYPENEANIWIGLSKGLALFNKKQGVFHYFDEFAIQALVPRNNLELFVGTRHSGVYLFNKHTGQFYRYDSKHKELFGDIDLNIRQILKDRSGRYWFATHLSGLYMYNETTDSLVHFTKSDNQPEGIKGNQIRALCEDNMGNIWVGTKSDGLNKYLPDSNKFIAITKKNSLPSNTIYSIIEDEKGNLWMGSHNGLIKYLIKENIFVQYNEMYGIQGRSFEPNAYLQAKDGMLYFGGSNGLNYFDPAGISKKKHVAPMIISSLKKYDEIIDTDIIQHKKYILSYKDNYISITYALLDYSDPNSNKYSYILENFDQQWIDAGNRNFASYTSLPPGKYTFRVKGANIDNVWNEDGISIDIIIPAPFWKRTWFILVLTLFIVALIFSIYLYRINLIRKNERILQKLVQQKTSDLLKANQTLEIQKNEIKSHNITLVKQSEQIKNQNKELEAFAYSVSHDLRAPIRHINGFLQLLQKALKPMDDKIQRYFDKISVSSGNMSIMIDELLKFSRLGRAELKSKQFNLSKVINEIISLYKLDYAERNIQWNIGNLPEVHGDPALLKIAFENIISNAIKYTAKKELAIIEIGQKENCQNNRVCIFIKDNGAGFDMTYKDKLFGVFQRLHKSEEFEGIGIGLANTKQIIKKHSGEINAESEIDKGATFYITLPNYK